jgi:response regulator RpfG family c-di-GMP phosphodiesterase
MTRILHLEDSPRDAEQVRDSLQQAGVNCELKVVCDRGEFESALAGEPFDLILSDYNLPGYDGMAALALVQKKQPRVPFIMISGSLGEEAAIECMVRGTTDYVLKQRLSRLGPSVRRALAESAERRLRLDAETSLRANRRLREELELLVEERTGELKNAMARLATTLESTTLCLSMAMEMRDPYTAGHQRRVTDLACAIWDSMSLSREGRDGLRIAGMLHDLGKIQIPADILSKPSLLSKAEFSLIQEHPISAWEILRLAEFPGPVATIVRQHHERLDGTGYPDGLKGGDILRESCVLAIADVVEAMASHRPYRAALGIDAALAEIQRGRGTAYSVDTVDACLRLFREDGYVLPT